MRRLASAVALAAALGAGAAPAAAYVTPGYTPVRRAPATKPNAPTSVRAVGLPAGIRAEQLVDDAGTAHITLVPAEPNPRTAIYCRLKRGAPSCDNAVTTLPPITGVGATATTFDFGVRSVRPFTLGGSLLVVGTATGGGPKRPDGTTMVATVWLWESRDGGQSFDEPVLIGDTRTVPLAIFGTPDAPRLLAARGDGLGNLFGAVLNAGSVTAGETMLLHEDRRTIAGAAAATQGGVPVLAYSHSVGSKVITSAGADRALDPSGFTTADVPGVQISVAGGPGGLLAATTERQDGRDVLAVRRVQGAAAGGAQRLGEGNHPRIAQHPAGAVALVARRGGELVTAAGTGGRLGPETALSLTTALAGTELGPLAIGPDGGGFELAHTGTGAREAWSALTLGAAGPTGKPGLGGLPGGSGPLPSGVTVTCARVKIGALVARALAGCLLPASDGSGRRVSESTIRLGGMDVVPSPGVKIIVDPRRRAIDTTGAVTIRLRGGDLDVPIFRGDLHITIPRGGSGDPLASFPAEALLHPSVGGFPLKGDADVFITERGVRIPLALQLPAGFGGIRGSAVLETDDGGLRVSSVIIDADVVPVPGGEIRDLHIDYGSGGNWSGRMRLVLHGGLELEFAVQFIDGRFVSGRVAVTKWPGIPIAQSVFLNRVGGDIKLDPDLVLGLDARVGAVPTYPNTGFVAGVDGRLQFTIPRNGPFEIKVSGDGDILGLSVAHAETVLRSDGYFRQLTQFGLDVAVASFKGDVDLAVDGRRGRFNAEFGLEACVHLELVDPCASAQAILSNRGLAACVEIDAAVFTGSAFIGYLFPDEPPLDPGAFDVGTGDGCNDDLTPYRVPVPDQGARAAQASGPVVTLGAGRRSASIELRSADGTPDVVLIAPDGQRVIPDGSDPRAGALRLARARRTVVLLRRPAAGAWRVEPTAASPAITGVRYAVSLPARTPIRARVVRGRDGLALRVTARARTGETIRFLERTRGGFERSLGTAKAGRVLVPGDDLGAGRRTVYAVREINGLSRSRERVASYLAPGARTPGSVRGLSVRRSRRAARIRFTASPQDTTRLTVTLRDGRRFVRDLPPGRRTTTLSALLPADRGTVRAARISPTGRVGPARRVAVRAGGRRTR